jgi:hypothetical protein
VRHRRSKAAAIRASAHSSRVGSRMPSPDVMWLNMTTSRLRRIIAAANCSTMLVRTFLRNRHQRQF